jgi:hypothetical protein
MRRANRRRAIVTWSTTSVLVVALLVTWAASAQARTAWAGPFAVDLYGSPAHRLTVTVARPALIVGSKLGGEARSGKVKRARVRHDRR